METGTRRGGRVRRGWCVSAVLALVACAEPSAQSDVLTPIMRDKLTNVQQLLEGVLTGNYTLMDRHGARIGRISLKEIATWQARGEPAYLRHGRTFLQAVQAFRSAVSARSPEQISSTYRALLGSCTGCHGYVRASKPAAAVPER